MVPSTRDLLKGLPPDYMGSKPIPTVCILTDNFGRMQNDVLGGGGGDGVMEGAWEY